MPVIASAPQCLVSVIPGHTQLNQLSLVKLAFEKILCLSTYIVVLVGFMTKPEILK